MKKSTIVSLVIFCLFSFSRINAQNNKTQELAKANPTKEVKEKAEKAKLARVNAAQKNHVRSVPKETPAANENNKVVNSNGLNEDDLYQGRTKEFLDLMVVDKIPADFPKYEKGTGVKYYNDVVENYFKQHLELLKEKPRKKLSRL